MNFLYFFAVMMLVCIAIMNADAVWVSMSFHTYNLTDFLDLKFADPNKVRRNLCLLRPPPPRSQTQLKTAIRAMTLPIMLFKIRILTHHLENLWNKNVSSSILTHSKYLKSSESDSFGAKCHFWWLLVSEWQEKKEEAQENQKKFNVQQGTVKRLNCKKVSLKLITNQKWCMLTEKDHR